MPYETDLAHELVESVASSVREGQRVVIVGPNGSGKTTLLRTALRLTGSKVARTPIWRNLPVDISYIPQDYRSALFPWLRLSGNLALHLRGRLPTVSDIEGAFRKAADAIGFALDLERFPYEISGGEQQIVVLLQAMIRRPKFLLADEPFSAIDLHKREMILQHFSLWLNRYQPTVFLVSHDLRDGLFLADKVVVLSRSSGRIKVDLDIHKPHPRPLCWRQDQDFADMLRHIIDAFE